jgi:hypothetical protein
MKSRLFWLRSILAMIAVMVSVSSFTIALVSAKSPFPPETSSGSVGIQGEISTAPPTRGATIATPVNGANITTIPVTVAGICPSSLLVKVFDNNVFVGSVLCVNGSYSVPVDLFSGQNDLVAIVYDSLDQAGPDSNQVTVNYTDAEFLQFGTHIQLTSNYAERGAQPNTELDWPVILSGGTGPYAISIDWGDGSPNTLISQSDQGTLNLSHQYANSGIYAVIVKGADANGGEAFLQLVADSTGSSQSNNKPTSDNTVTVTKLIWWPAAAMIPLFFAVYWLGRRAELFGLRKELEKTRDGEKGKDDGIGSIR